jgi:hypothetical protein
MYSPVIIDNNVCEKEYDCWDQSYKTIYSCDVQNFRNKLECLSLESPSSLV